MGNNKARSFFYNLIHPIWQFVSGILLTVYGIFALIRDEFLPKELAEKLRIGGIIKMIAWYWWVISGLLILWVGTAWNSSKRENKIIKGEEIKIKTITEHFNENEKYTQCVYFKITNRSGFDLRDCFLKLNTAKAKLGEYWADAIEFVDPNINEFSWTLFDYGEEKFIRAKDSARVNIACSNFDNVVFAFEKEERELNGLLGGNYYLEIEFNGKINGEPIESTKIKGFLYHTSHIKIYDNEPPYTHTNLYFEEGILEDENS